MSDYEELKQKLLSSKKHACDMVSDEEITAADAFCDGYMSFLSACKTERECVGYAVDAAEKNGFVPFDKSKKYKAGDKVYVNNRGKAVILAVIGRKSLLNGVRIAAAHIDSPRLDLKPQPVFESDEIAFFKPHYYGGIKKYQWPVMPLALHGTVILSDGTQVDVSVGEKPEEPKFMISDILPHLGAEQGKRNLSEGIAGEELNIIIGSRPLKCDGGSELVKLNILNILNEKYGICEEDFLSAELEVVPAFSACDIGFDRSLIGAYGHDDRVCAYPALMAAINAAQPELTTVTVLTDKEEIGSEGNTGLKSAYLKYFICDLADNEGVCARDILSASECLSADVNAAFDPTFSSVFEKNNSSYINHGVVITKYTGARGKSGTSDASAEFMGRVRRVLDKNGVIWQSGELGKVDAGGGGTVAKFIAELNVDVVDMGVPVLAMHAPFECVSKIDVYMAYRAFYEFFAQ